MVFFIIGYKTSNAPYAVILREWRCLISIIVALDKTLLAANMSLYRQPFLYIPCENISI